MHQRLVAIALFQLPRLIILFITREIIDYAKHSRNGPQQFEHISFGILFDYPIAIVEDLNLTLNNPLV